MWYILIHKINMKKMFFLTNVILIHSFVFTYKSTGVLGLTGWFNDGARGWGDLVWKMAGEVIHVMGEIRLQGDEKTHKWRQKTKWSTCNRMIMQDNLGKKLGIFELKRVSGTAVDLLVLPHPVVEGVLRPGHPAEVRAVGLGGQRAGEGAGGGAGGRGLTVPRLGAGRCFLQGQRGIRHSAHVHLLPCCTDIYKAAIKPVFISKLALWVCRDYIMQKQKIKFFFLLVFSLNIFLNSKWD